LNTVMFSYYSTCTILYDAALVVYVLLLFIVHPL